MPTVADLAPRLQQALLLDWDAADLRGPTFVAPDGAARKRLADLANPRGDGALTWSAFRTLQHFPPAMWLPHLLGIEATSARWEPLGVEWWPRVAPPTGRLLWLLDHLDALAPADPRQADAAKARLERVAGALDRWRAQAAAASERGDGILEAAYEPDLVVRTPDALVVVVGLYRHDIEARTAWDPQRDAIARGIDAALELADGGQQPWYLLVTDDYHHEGPNVQGTAYEWLMPRYQGDAAWLAARLPHRTADHLARVAGRIRWLSWADLMDVVLDHQSALNGEQRLQMRRLVDYLRDRRLLFKGG